MVSICKRSGGISILEEQADKTTAENAKGVLKKMYNNSKAAFKSFRKFQDALRKEFPGLVKDNKEESKNIEVKKDDGRIQEVYERRVRYYKDD